MPQQPTTWSGPAQVNTDTTGFQGQSRIIGLSNGNILVAFADDSPVGTGAGRDVVGVIYNALGAVVAAGLQLNDTFFSDTEEAPSIAATNDGGFYVVYEDTNGSGTSLRIDRFDENGVRTNGTTVLSDPGTPVLNNPVIAVDLDDNSFVVTYEYRDGGLDQIRSRAFDGDLNFVVARTLADDEDPTNTLLTGDPKRQDTAALSNGAYVTVFDEGDDFGGLNEQTVELRITRPNGTRGAQVEVSTDDGFDASHARVAGLADGGFVVVWLNLDMNQAFVRIFENDGTPRTGVLGVPGSIAGTTVLEADVIGLEDGSFYVAYREDTGELSGALFDSNGVALTDAVQTGVTNANSIDLGTTSDGRILLTYQSVSPGNDVQFMILDSRSATIVADDGDGQVTARLDDDTYVYGSGSAEAMYGFNGADWFKWVETVYPGSVDTIDGGSGADTFEVTALTQQALVDLGSELFTDGNITNFASTTGSTILAHLESIENVIVRGNQDIRGDLGDNVLTALGDFRNEIMALNGNDLIDAGAGDDLVQAGSGDDTVTGGSGADQIYGDEGNDLFIVEAGDLVWEFAGDGDDTVQSATSYTLQNEIEHLELTDTGVSGQGNGLANTITGNDASNELNGLGANDTILGQGGDDEMDGGAGSDSMNGGEGNDTYYVDVAQDRTTEASDNGGIDTILTEVNRTLGANQENMTLVPGTATQATGNELDNELIGNERNNKLQGEAGNDTLFGDDGEDELRGAEGDDTMYGGADSDLYFVDSLADFVIEDAGSGLAGGNDTTYVTVDGYQLDHDVEIMRMQGTDALSGLGNDLGNRMVGNSAANVLSGEEGDDRLEGGDGADTLEGGTGNDTMTGGSQGDVFRLKGSTIGADRIEDFNRNADRFDMGTATFTAMSVAGADTILTHAQGTVRIAGVSNLSLAEWNALILPSGSAGGGPLPFSLVQSALAQNAGAGDWFFA